MLWLLEAEKALEDDTRVQHPLGDGTVGLGHLSVQRYAHPLRLRLDEGFLDRTENLIIFLIQLNHALLGHAALSVLLDHLRRRDLGDDIRRRDHTLVDLHVRLVRDVRRRRRGSLELRFQVHQVLGGHSARQSNSQHYYNSWI